MTQLQKIVAKAKTLRKSYPNAKWTDLIKKASKLVTPASKSVAGTKKKSVKKHAPVKPLAKKKKAVAKRSTTRSAESEKIRKSVKKDGFIMPHGYGVTKGKRLISGVNDKYLDDLNKWVKLSKSYQSDLLLWKDKLKAAKKYKVPDAIKTYTGYVNLYTRELKNIKQHIAQLKKHIK
jgi:hypothetical protein